MPQKKHDFTFTEIKAGIMVLLSVAVLVAFIAVANGMRPQKVSHEYTIYFADTEGLNVGADVRFGGKKVGRVSSIGFTADDQSLIEVVVNIHKDVPVNDKCEAFVTQATLTSSKHVEISTGSKDAVRLESGATLPSKTGSLMGQMAELSTAVQGLMADVQGLVADLRGLLGVKDFAQTVAADGEEKELVTIAALFGSVDEGIGTGISFIEDTRAVLAENSGDISVVLKKLQDIEDGASSLLGELEGVISENRADIRGVVTETKSLVSGVSEAAAKLEEIAKALKDTLESAEALTGEAQNMLKDNGPVIGDMLLDLQETVQYLKEFSQSVADQPQSLIRGKKLQGRE